MSYIEMKRPWVHMSSPSRYPLPPPSPPAPSRSSQSTRSERLSHASNLGHFLFPILWLQHQGSLHVWRFPRIQLVCTDTVLDGLLGAANGGITSVITFVMWLVFCVVILCSWRLIALHGGNSNNRKIVLSTCSSPITVAVWFFVPCIKLMFSHVWLFETLWTVAYQVPPPMGFSRLEYWSGSPFPPSRDLPNQGIEPMFPELQADYLSAEPSGKTVQFSSVIQSCPTLCDPMDCCVPGFFVHHQLLEFTQTYVHQVSDTIQPSHLLSSPFPLAFSLSQPQGLLQWVSSLDIHNI